MVTHHTTNWPACGLSTAERTGSPVLHTLWSYVLVTSQHWAELSHFPSVWRTNRLVHKFCIEIRKNTKLVLETGLESQIRILRLHNEYIPLDIDWVYPLVAKFLYSIHSERNIANLMKMSKHPKTVFEHSFFFQRISPSYPWQKYIWHPDIPVGSR